MTDEKIKQLNKLYSNESILSVTSILKQDGIVKYITHKDHRYRKYIWFAVMGLHETIRIEDGR